MNTEVVSFLALHRIAVLTVLAVDGSPHSATVHFAFDPESQFCYFLSGKESMKAQSLVGRKEVAASLVVGFSEEEWVTAQMHGTVELLEETAYLEKGWQIYTQKFAGAEKNKNDDSLVLIRFTTTWWKYSRIKPYPSVVLTS